MKKNNISVMITMICVFGAVACCKSESEPETVALYDKPLQEIEKHIQGKWKILSSSSSSMGRPIEVFYPENSFVEFNCDSENYVSSNDEKISTHQFTWERMTTWLHPGIETHVIWVTKSNFGAWCFDHIKGDRLEAASCIPYNSYVLIKSSK